MHNQTSDKRSVSCKNKEEFSFLKKMKNWREEKYVWTTPTRY